MSDAVFRKYDPSAGRWLSPDPSAWGAVDQTSPQSLNRYAYVENNPMSLVDLNGLLPIPCPDAPPGVSIGDDGVPTFYIQGCDNGACDPNSDFACGQQYQQATQPITQAQTPYQPGGGLTTLSALAIPPAPPKSCSEQLNDMLYDINAIRVAASDFKGLAQRYNQLSRMSGDVYEGHATQYEQREIREIGGHDTYSLTAGGHGLGDFPQPG